jgi:predicted nucleotidyltransferase
VRLKERHVSDLNSVVDVISRIHDVVGVFLFGSFARGDYDETSDYDLLVLFENKASMWQNWDKLFQSITSLKMNLHAIPETLEELKAANPVFLDELSKHGRVLFAKFPLEVFPKPARLKPFNLIIYSMRGLSYSDKMKTIYFLHRKNGQGVVAQTGGKRLGESCFLIPSSVGNEIIDKLSALGVRAKKLEIYVSEDQLETQPQQQAIS